MTKKRIEICPCHHVKLTDCYGCAELIKEHHDKDGKCLEFKAKDVKCNCKQTGKCIDNPKTLDELVLLKEQLSKAKGDIHIIEQCMAFKNFSYPCMNTDCSFGKRKVCPLRFNGSFENLFGEKI